MTHAEHSRVSWSDLPDELHRAVASILGSDVISASNQHHGFSPGSADRVITIDGYRAFVKAVHYGRNAYAAELHRREARVLAALPQSVHAPRLLHFHESDEWVALVLEDIDGGHPGAARDGSDISAVIDALASLPTVRGSSLRDLPNAADELAGEADGWAQLRRDNSTNDLPEWVRASFDRLEAAASTVASAARGDFLVHLDCRADNVLIDPGGTAWIIDWPWASVGARWLDGACYLLDARRRQESFDADGVLEAHPLFAGVSDEAINSVLAALAGGFFHKASQPALPNMPTLRAFQRSEAIAAADWLHDRWVGAA
ncbi:phosphotransferase family protein [Marisediminicola senii]|uniref:phosphotransferase family protein n=1 Tax=Marisediminicola senii TaxID=2711233 RepID=UPI0013EBA432|nr:phosphotransferase [Marisediminicola senii]